MSSVFQVFPVENTGGMTRQPKNRQRKLMDRFSNEETMPLRHYNSFLISHRNLHLKSCFYVTFKWNELEKFVVEGFKLKKKYLKTLKQNLCISVHYIPPE